MNYKLITSRKNKLITEAASLADTAGRRKAGMFLAEGARLCADAAGSGLEISALFYTEKAASRYGEYLEKLRASSKDIYIIEEHVAEKLSETKNTQGVFCRIRIPRLPEKELDGKTVVLEDMQDPANLGAVIRTAEALGIDDIVLLGRQQDVYSPKVLRASMGSVFRMPVRLFPERRALFDALKAAGSRCYAAALDETAAILGSFKFPGKAAVFIGNEGSGLAKETVLGCGEMVMIPMKGRAESLNAGASAAILMWEMVR